MLLTLKEVDKPTSKLKLNTVAGNPFAFSCSGSEEKRGEYFLPRSCYH